MMEAAALCTLAWLASASPPRELPSPVELVPFQCEALTDADVRPALAVEMRGRLLDEMGPIPSGAVTVSVSCRGADVILAAASPGQIGPPLRFLELSVVAASARPRTVALAIAELVRPDVHRDVSPDLAPTTADDEPTAAAQPVPDRLAIDSRNRTEILVGAVGQGFASQLANPLTGGHLRWTYFWLRGRAPQLSGWWLGPSLDASFVGTSFGNGAGDLAILSGAFATTAEHPFGLLTPQVTIGERFGVAMFDGQGQSDAASKRFTGGPFLELGLKVGFGFLRLRCAAEVGFPMMPPESFCAGTACANFSGPWFATRVDAAVTF
jgi:hypothetical protein